mmetsp:Transcript_2593/g.6076  ORF Transcript_2593/g.6076 Transcript_2593/m.6076 type:complete len:212 (+) Transcript_2593:954-1589(+)
MAHATGKNQRGESAISTSEAAQAARVSARLLYACTLSFSKHTFGMASSTSFMGIPSGTGLPTLVNPISLTSCSLYSYPPSYVVSVSSDIEMARTPPADRARRWCCCANCLIVVVVVVAALGLNRARLRRPLGCEHEGGATAARLWLWPLLLLANIVVAVILAFRCTPPPLLLLDKGAAAPLSAPESQGRLLPALASQPTLCALQPTRGLAN